MRVRPSTDTGFRSGQYFPELVQEGILYEMDVDENKIARGRGLLHPYPPPQPSCPHLCPEDYVRKPTLRVVENLRLLCAKPVLSDAFAITNFYETWVCINCDISDYSLFRAMPERVTARTPILQHHAAASDCRIAIPNLAGPVLAVSSGKDGRRYRPAGIILLICESISQAHAFRFIGELARSIWSAHRAAAFAHASPPCDLNVCCREDQDRFCNMISTHRLRLFDPTLYIGKFC
ncbi:hypothetical protein EVAR_93687_1 [Eumeta japonica]|uniref:Uncharacterized protein n=1 Tax=Eumeta variegata TaxID=151549 RepID=A0A4C1U2H2_EUMVA|nr:hypothetical protein EVAR_93687_1 [Eumeta japonica]